MSNAAATASTGRAPAVQNITVFDTEVVSSTVGRIRGLFKISQSAASRAAILSVCILLSSCASTSDEPPFGLGSGAGGDTVRKTSLKEMVSDPPGVVYEIEYARVGLTSLARLDFTTRAMLEEVFAGKWRVVYEYRDSKDKVLKVPSAILVYKDGHELQQLINRYELTELVPQEGARYKDKTGRSRLITYEYFDVMPGSPF